jgi:hypothetical protein
MWKAEAKLLDCEIDRRNAAVAYSARFEGTPGAGSMPLRDLVVVIGNRPASDARRLQEFRKAVRNGFINLNAYRLRA